MLYIIYSFALVTNDMKRLRRDIMQWLPESSIPSINNNRWEENKNPR